MEGRVSLWKLGPFCQLVAALESVRPPPRNRFSQVSESEVTPGALGP